MPKIKIQDSRQSASGSRFLNFDLRDILAVIGEPVSSSKWRCDNLVYTMNDNGQPLEIREPRLKLSGAELIELASKIHQTIDGRFEAKATGAAARNAWLIIKAFDSSWFEVWTSKQPVIDRLKFHFQAISDL